MKKTIKGRLTTAVTIIVMIAVLISTGTIIGMSSTKMTGELKEELQLQADKYAHFINSWIEMEKGLNDGTAASIEALSVKETDEEHLQAIISSHADERTELLNLYYGTAEKQFIQSEIEAGVPEGYDPTQRGWYKAAESAGKTVVTDPYMDVLIGGMCITVATPVYKEDKLLGVVGADFTLDTITGIVNDIPYEKGEYGFLVDASGNYVIHKNESYLPGEDTAVSVTEVMPSLSKLIGKSGQSVLKEKDYDGNKKYFVVSEIKGCSWLLGLSLPTDNIMGNIYNTILISIVIAVVAIVIAYVIMAGLIRQQLKPLAAMKGFVREKIIGAENLEEQRTEVKEIDYLIGELEHRFIDTIHRTREESLLIQEKMSGTSSHVASINDSISEITSAMQHTGDHIESQTDSIRKIDDTCGIVSLAVDELSKDTSLMNERAGEIIQRVEAIVPEILQNKHNAVSVTQDSGEKLARAIEGVKVINQIAEVSDAISNIAGQTNLLALNASIEAARAGESGRGFAVVADEINNLSQTTSNEITKVNDLIKKVTDSVADLSAISNEILTFLSDVVLKDYDHLETMAQNYKSDAGYYGTISSTLGESANKLDQSVGEITHMLKSINTYQGALNRSIHAINENLGNISKTSENVSIETQEVMVSITTLKETVGRFHV